MTRQVGSGPRGRRFKSSRPDQIHMQRGPRNRAFLLYGWFRPSDELLEIAPAAGSECRNLRDFLILFDRSVTALAPAKKKGMLKACWCRGEIVPLNRQKGDRVASTRLFSINAQFVPIGRTDRAALVASALPAIRAALVNPRVV
jgi:hypothetical protein